MNTIQPVELQPNLHPTPIAGDSQSAVAELSAPGATPRQYKQTPAQLRAQRKYRAQNRAKVNAQSRARFAANPELHRARVRASQRKHREANLERQAIWRSQNRERERVRSRAWAAAHKGEGAQYRKEYHAKNRAKRNAYSLAYQKANPDIFRVNASAYRAKLRGATVGSTKPILAWEKAWRSKTTVTCYWCLKPKSPDVCQTDHVQSLKKGGAHELGNLCIACNDCNHSKSARTLENWNKLIEQPALL